MKLAKLSFTFFFLLSALFLASLALSPGTYAGTPVQTILGIWNASSDAIGTHIFQKGPSVVFTWPQGASYAYINLALKDGKMVTDLISRLKMQSNIISYETYSRFLSNLEVAGFQEIDPKALPGGFRSELLRLARWLGLGIPAGGIGFKVWKKRRA